MTPLNNAAIVLGGGGVTGIAWLVGVLAGLQRSGIELTRCSEFIGTSAGSVVSAELASGLAIDTLLDQQFNEVSQELARPYSQKEADEKNQILLQKVQGDLTRARQRIGAFALRSPTPTLDERRAIIQARLSSHRWPEKALRVVAVDTVSAREVQLERGGPLDLVDAVMASCAVPGVWPPVPMGERTLMDGGIRSMTNADLAVRNRHVLILAPLGYSDGNPISGHLRAEIDRLVSAGAEVDTIVPNQESSAAIGDNVLDPSRRHLSAQAGLQQGLSQAATLDAYWRR